MPTNKLAFLADQRRINVAVTRAKRHVSIICDSDTVSADNFLRGMLNHVESLEANGSIFSAEEFKDEISRSNYVECIDKAASESLVDSKANVINTDKETKRKKHAKRLARWARQSHKKSNGNCSEAKSYRQNRYGSGKDEKNGNTNKQLEEINKQSQRSSIKKS